MNEQALEAAERQLATVSLSAFTKRTFSQYRENWHHRLICEVIDKMHDPTSGMQNVMILMGPRRGKTQLAARQNIPYVFGRDPSAQVIYASASLTLARRTSRDVRNIITSEEYQRIFDARLGDSKNIDQWDVTTQRAIDGYEEAPNGMFLPVSVGKAFQGFGMTDCIVDDFCGSRAEAESKTIRDKWWDWWNSDLMSRAMYPCRKILMVTPWHSDDLVGRLLKTEGEDWFVLRLPEKITPDAPAGPLDPREEGEFLWPGFFQSKHEMQPGNEVDYEELVARAQSTFTKKRRADSYAHDAMCQCNPRGKEGTLMNEEEVRTYEADPRVLMPTFDAVLISVDCNFKNKKTADRVSIAIFGKKKQDIYLLDEVVGRWSFPNMVRIVATLKANHPRAGVLIEVKANGQALVDTLREMIPDVLEFEPGNTSKTARAQVAANRVKAGQLHVPGVQHLPTVSAWVDEVVHYGERAFDDRMDSLSQVCIYWQSKKNTIGGLNRFFGILGNLV